MYFLLAKRTICYTSTFETEKDLYVYSTHIQHKEKWLDYDITDVDYLISICHTHTHTQILQSIISPNYVSPALKQAWNGGFFISGWKRLSAPRVIFRC